MAHGGCVRRDHRGHDVLTYIAAKRVKTAADFYAAGGGVTGLQNGWAIAGDYLSAASFLGIAGLISLNGYDGFMYSVGWLVAYITVLLVIAEPAATSASSRSATFSRSVTIRRSYRTAMALRRSPCRRSI